LFESYEVSGDLPVSQETSIQTVRDLGDLAAARGVLAVSLLVELWPLLSQANPAG
jgi:hypothetical protein